MVFVEFPAFTRARDACLNDDEFRLLQAILISDPDAGVIMPGTGGLRKLRLRDRQHGRGTRGGYRVIYYWFGSADEFLLCALYSKTEMTDLTTSECLAIAALVHEYRTRKT